MFTHNMNPRSCVQYCLKKSKGLLCLAFTTLLLFSGLFTYAGDAPVTSTLSIIKTHATADNLDKNIVKVNVVDASNNPLAGQSVVFTITSGTASFIGATTVTTNASGDAQISLSSTVAGMVTVSALVNGSPLTSGDPSVVDFIAGSPSVANAGTTITVVTDNQPADGSSKNIVKVHVVDANGNPVTNQDVSFNVNVGGSGVSYVVKTDANGDAILPLSSTTAGSVIVTAKVNGATVVNGSPATVHFVAGPPDVTQPKTQLWVSKSGHIADGTDIDQVTALVVDANGNPVVGATITFTIIAGSATFSTSATVTTNSLGVATVNLTSLVAGYSSITATVNGIPIINGSPAVIVFYADVPSVNNPQTKISVTTNNVTADGTTPDVIVAHIVDKNGNSVPGATVVFTQTTGSGVFVGTTTVVTDASGNATIKMTSTVAGDNNITATVNGTAIINGSPAIAKFVAGPPSSANPATAISVVTDNAKADGSATDQIKVHVVDANGNPVANTSVTFAKTAGSGTFIGSVTVTTDANGDAFITMTSTVAGVNSITATIGGTPVVNGSPAKATFVADVPSVTNPATNISVTQNNATANGTATDQIKVHVVDANGNKVAGATVVFTQANGSGTFTSATTVTTDANGDAFITMTSTVAGSNDITATVNGTVITNGSPAKAVFVADVPKTNVPTTKLTVTKNNAAADGVDVDKITAHITDANGNPVAGATVVFTKASGSGTFTTSVTVITDANGDAVVSMTSTAAGSNDITATVNGSAITNGSPAKAVFKADVPSVTNPATAMTVVQDNAKANGTDADKIKVHVVDANGNPVQGATVVFTSTSGSATFSGSNTVTTDANGDAIVSMTSTVVGSNTITATVNGVAITNGNPATVKFVSDVPSVNTPTTKITVTKNDALADGTDVDKVTVHVTDANGNPVAGATVDFAKSGSAVFVGTTTLTTDANGDATISLTSTASGITNVTAKVNGTDIINGSPAKASFKSGTVVVTNPDTKLTVVKDNAFADGVDADSVRVHAVDANGNPVAGATVVFTKKDGNGVVIGTITVVTDANGDATAGITSNDPGEINISATVDGSPVTGGVKITFRPAIDFTNPLTAITVVQDNAMADNIATNIVKVHLVDMAGNPVANAQVDFDMPSGTAIITTPMPIVTDANGDAIITLTSGTPNEVSITAAVNGNAITNGSPAKIHFMSLSIDIIVAKVFTPNNDGINDILKPILIGVPELKTFSIYNRWGNLIFSTKDANTGWDGTLKGTPQPVETYLWFAEGIDKNGKVIQRKGMVTLAR
ncbi:Ig-like domain-containing protein [Pinibacter aurantiacus]|uniref:Ig-like domain-containing protein n=1 Tax=Pinibacter aurantiacus TaxID=2851599 RepID=A0A9E2S836_9BACT|nr:Ig-like domain-containing protein [Pinibacter aurantiacus]MBV4355685.1 Ig-like domain-containing protein [Pinibacter aurantiacus]